LAAKGSRAGVENGTVRRGIDPAAQAKLILSALEACLCWDACLAISPDSTRPSTRLANLTLDMSASRESLMASIALFYRMIFPKSLQLLGSCFNPAVNLGER